MKIWTFRELSSGCYSVRLVKLVFLFDREDQNTSVFFPAWKPKVCVKRFFGHFWSFFTDKKSLSRTFFPLSSRTLFRFHGHVFEVFRNFTGTFLVSRTLFCYLFFSRAFSFSRALFSIFFTQVFLFFTQEKKHWNTLFFFAIYLDFVNVILLFDEWFINR